MEFQKYFQSYEDYFWEWDNQIFAPDEVFEAITIPNGATIGYEKFVFEILEFLSDDSIPPFGSLLLAIIATNPENGPSIQMIYDFGKRKESADSFRTAKSLETSNFFRIGSTIGFMKILSSLPEDYKTGEKRMKLFQTIFHECHNRISSEKAKKVIEDFKKNRYDVHTSSSLNPFNEANFIKDFRTLALLKVKFPTVQSILKAMEDLPYDEVNDKLDEQVLEEKNLSESVTNFVDQLIEEDKTFHVGSLIKRLWSGLNIPLHHNHPSEQPLGGISDLTNKGDFDKLVISEFAYDDDVFMSRIANNEALYIQREVPPEADKFERILLIDSSLKNWGNPKILSFASAIAIARHPKTDIECKVFVVGENYEEVTFDDVNHVIKALSKLSGKLDCATGLNAFFLENKISSKNQEVFLFSSEESLKMTPMQKVTNDYFADIKYTFSVGMQDITVFKNHNKRKKMLQHIIMPLDELWVRNSKEIEITDFVESLDKESLPLLYPVERFYYNIFQDGNVFYQCLGRTLFMFQNNYEFKKALKKITSNAALLGKGEFALKTNADRERILLNYYFYDGVHNISFLNLQTNELKSRKGKKENLPQKNLSAFESHGMFYLTDNISYWILNDDFTTAAIKGENIKLAYDDYFEKRASFIRDYKASRTKYNTIKRLETVAIDENVLMINGYYFRNLKFGKERLTFRPDGMIVLKEKVNLILKNRGNSAMEIIKIIKNNTDNDLREAKEIVDKEFGVVLSNVTKEIAEKLKKKIEAVGAVCFIETAFFEAKDGSRISNKDGILVFESNDTSVNKFYIPFVLNVQSTMVSGQEWTGNQFFFSEEHKQISTTLERFEKNYLKPFIHNITHHGA
jgi:hypothetical protein